jgi:hypothetical protein
MKTSWQIVVKAVVAFYSSGRGVEVGRVALIFADCPTDPLETSKVRKEVRVVEEVYSVQLSFQSLHDMCCKAPHHHITSASTLPTHTGRGGWGGWGGWGVYFFIAEVSQ